MSNTISILILILIICLTSILIASKVRKSSFNNVDWISSSGSIRNLNNLGKTFTALNDDDLSNSGIPIDTETITNIMSVNKNKYLL